MRASYNIRRSSVVFNPRGGVFGGLRGGYEGEGTGGDTPPGGGDVPEGDSSVTESMAAAAAAAAAADADAIAAQIALESSSKQAYQAMAEAAATAAKSTRNIRALVGMIPVVGTIVKAFEIASSLFSNMQTASTQPGYAASQAAASRALSEASAIAAGPGGDERLVVEVAKVQNALQKATAANQVSIEAAVTTLYQTYAKRNPDPEALIFWSNTFGPTITADEVLQFQNVLYANEPNLRPVATATKTTTQSSNNLTLPIIAAVAGFLLFGS